jgi:phage repressor protein C with HTH and peptisase S24 domain
MDELAWIRRGLQKPGRTQSGLARALGRSPSAVTALLKGERQLKVREIAIIADYLGEEPPPNVAIPAPEPGAQMILRNNAGAPEPSRLPRRRLPVYGLARGGDDGRFVLNGQRVADVLCPPSLEHVPEAYAVFIHGESMEPRYYPGETAWVHPHLPVRAGDFVVAQIFAGEGEPPLGFVKRFVSRNSRELVLEQFNPPEGQDRLMRFPASHVISVHRILFAGQS